MKSEQYTPGHTTNASEFMAQRSSETHGEFFRDYLDRNVSVLDCGCGPGSITIGIADRIAPGEVVGIDFAASQVERATETAERAGLKNVKFQTADCYSLPFAHSTFDRVFSHALLEHLASPGNAVREMVRVLKPNGVIGVCAPDWGGFLAAPPSDELTHAIEVYKNLQTQNGGDVYVGRKLGDLFADAGCSDIRMSARYECYESLQFIGEYLAIQLEQSGEKNSADVLRKWSGRNSGMFAQAWVVAIGRK